MLKTTCLLLFMVTLLSVKKPSDNFKPVAVIELFTSEGCSSCPPADKLLAKTLSEGDGTNPIIFALAFHVDYWNRLGWKDSFSSAQFSQRQNMYASAMHLDGVYTPQMVVNGTTQLVGSDKSALDDAILKSLATKTETAFSDLKATGNGNMVTVNYGLEGNVTGCRINFAFITLHTATSVKNGENRGRLLEHTNVVRQFISSSASASGNIVFHISVGYNASNTAVVAYVQKQNGLQIVAAAMTKLVGN